MADVVALIDAAVPALVQCGPPTESSGRPSKFVTVTLPDHFRRCILTDIGLLAWQGGRGCFDWF